MSSEINNYFNQQQAKVIDNWQFQNLNQHVFNYSHQYKQQNKQAQVNQDAKPGTYTIQSFLKYERNQMSNMDRFMEATIPAGIDVEQDGPQALMQAYQKVSMHGLKLELPDDQNLDLHHVYTFMPTLSSLYLLTKLKNNANKKSTIIEFHEDKPPFKRKPLSLAFQEALEPICFVSKAGELETESGLLSSSSQSDDSSSSSEASGDSILKINRQQKSSATERSTVQCLTKFSWYAILWTCQKCQTIPSNSEDQKMRGGSANNVQFWVVYKFDANGQIVVVGMLTYKFESQKEQFWVTPTLLECENNLKGQLFDEIYDENIIRLQDMQEKAIKFMQAEGQSESSPDFQFLMKSQNLTQIPGYFQTQHI